MTPFEQAGVEHQAVVVDLGAYRRARLSYPEIDPELELARIFARARVREVRVDDGPLDAA